MVFYRKYRPQTIGELDSKKLRDTLFSVLSSPSIPHAFLFTGPKGLGKTSTARIIAKVVNCEHTVNHPDPVLDTGEGSPRNVQKQGDSRLRGNDVSSIEPCNACDQCVSITNGSNIDVLEIDGASNRGIDEIRELRDRVKLAPSAAKKKVYIIDEVHMLTTEAFNALLKTIEEPPSHVMFIFCTTELQKVPATIVSRCMHISLHEATQEELVHAFERIVIGEKLDVDKEALIDMARFADGGFRDGVKVLEEMVQLAHGQKITKEFVEKTYHVSSITHYVSEFLQVIREKKTKESLRLVQNLVEQGVDIKYFLTQVLKELHKTLLIEVGVYQQNERDSGVAMLPRMTVEEIQILVSLLSEAYLQTKTAVIPQLPLEIAVIVYCNQDAEVKTQETNKLTMTTLLKKQQAVRVANSIRPLPKETVVPPAGATVSQGNIHSQENGSASVMENLIYKIKMANHSLAGVLRGCIIKTVGETDIVFETAYTFHKDRLEEKKSYEIIEKAVKELTGKQLKVVVQLKK